MERNKVLRTASFISIFGNLILSVLKIAVGLYAGSLAVLGDGLDSLSDIFISLITLAASIIISRPPDKEHPYGHFRAETIATSILAFIIFFIGGQLTLSTIEKIINHAAIRIPGVLAVYVTLFSIIGKLLLSWSQFALGKKTGSALLAANGKNMLNDAVTSAGVLTGLGCIFFFQLPVIDRVLAVIIGVWIMITSVRIFMGTITELMEGEENKDIYDKIFGIVKQVDSTLNPHRVRIRKLGALYAVDLDVEVDGNLTVKDAHNRTRQLEEQIREAMPNIYDIVIHVEPIGNVEEKECYGLSMKDIIINLDKK